MTGVLRASRVDITRELQSQMWVGFRLIVLPFASSCILLDEQKLGIIWFWPFRNRVSPTFSVLMTDCQ